MGGRYVLVAVFALLFVSSAAAITSDQRAELLATLASKMLTFTGADDYAMECGPGDEVVNQLPSGGISALEGKDYCVMNLSTPTAAVKSKLLIGTYALGQVTAQDALRSYNDSLFSAHLGPADIDPSACNGKGLSETFELCDAGGNTALKGFATYVNDQSTTNGVTYIVVSEQTLGTAIQGTGIVQTIINFIRSLLAAVGL
jgi:hypothetical protein